MIRLVALIPLFPLIGFLINGFFGKKISKGLSGAIASLSILASFILSIFVFAELQASSVKEHVVHVFSWINSGHLSIPFEFLVDPLSSWFLLIITGIGFLIHIYSTGYMHEDEGFSRFFTYLNLFVFFMLLLVLASVISWAIIVQRSGFFHRADLIRFDDHRIYFFAYSGLCDACRVFPLVALFV